MPDYKDPFIPAPSDGVTRGDSKPMPNRGTSVGFTGVGNDTYGADVGVNATNRLGPATDTGSDPMMLDTPKGDEDRFTSSGGTHGEDPGAGMGGAAKSDAAADTTPENPKQ
jgi:hypothetical protein